MIILKSKKLELYFNTILLELEENKDSVEPINNLISNFEEIKTLLNLKVQIIFKNFYFNRNNIKKILYEKEKLVDLDPIGTIKDLSCLFYLNLVIRENPNQIDYTYSIDLIKEINNLQKNNNDKIYQKLIISKIIIELIKNYKQTDNYIPEKEKEILKNIKKENTDIIENSIKNLNEIGLKMTKEDIISKNSKKLDEIYIDIIIELIKQRKFDDYKNIKEILNELDLKNIFITKKMFDELSKILNSNEKFIKDHMINNFDDLSNTENINFYYVLFKNILKNSMYIYQNSYLLKIRKNIITIIKSGSEQLTNLLNNNKDNNIEHIIYIIKFFTDTEYYINIDKKYIPFNNKSYQERNQEYRGENSLLPSQRSSQTKEIKATILDSIDEIAKILLNNSSFTFEINEMKINKIILNNRIVLKRKDKKNELKEIEIEYEDLKSIKEKLYINSELNRNFNRFITILEDFTNSLKNNITNNNNFKIILEFKRNMNDIVKNNLYNINLLYKLNHQIEVKIFEDIDILNIEKIKNAEGFLYLVEEINQN